MSAAHAHGLLNTYGNLCFYQDRALRACRKNKSADPAVRWGTRRLELHLSCLLTLVTRGLPLPLPCNGILLQVYCSPNVFVGFAVVVGFSEF